MNTWIDFHIVVPSGPGPEVYTACPQCSHARKKRNAKCLSVNIEKLVWFCSHCSWSGSLKAGQERTGLKLYRRPVWPTAPTVTDPLIAWFANRGISRATVEREGISLEESYLVEVEDRVPCIAFPYRKCGEVVNVKYRGLTTKAFQQVGGAEKILYRQDSILKDRVIICEGEADTLACVEAGLLSAVSVPDGAPAVSTKNYAAKFTYLDQDPDPFEGVKKIVLAVDADEPGQVLQRELGRRLGTDRCWFVEWPPDCKDANEVLLRYGPEFLRLCVEQARPFPVQDVVEVLSLSSRIMERYYHAPARGLSTGWDAVDELYTVEPGQLTIVTGVPSSGKSEWLDALC